MANESRQTFKYKNFKQILSYYSSLVRQAMFEPVDGLSENTPFMPAYWKIPPSTDSTDNYWSISREPTIIYNSGHSYGQGLLDAFENTSNRILEALRTLFINYDDPKELQQEDFNFNLLNAYASASQSLQWYNSETEEFEDMPEYWFTRGCWYEMLPMCTKGDYLKTWHGNVLQAVEAIKKCRRYYQYEFVYYLPDPYDSDDYGYSTSYSRRSSYYTSSRYSTYGLYSRRGTFSMYGNTQGYIQAFWTYYRKTLEDEVNSLLEPIWAIGRGTNLKEQTAETAKLTYITQLASDIDAIFSAGSTLTSTAKTLSSMCGTYSAKDAGLKLSK